MYADIPKEVEEESVVIVADDSSIGSDNSRMDSN